MPKSTRTKKRTHHQKDIFARSQQKQNDRKNQQLCAQVGRAVNDALSLSEDIRLSTLWVDAVIPDPGPHRLLVTLHLDEFSSDIADLTVLKTLLAKSKNRIREEVAASITRRRTPHLTFMILEKPSS